MSRSKERHNGMSAAIFSLWRNWAVSVGFLTLLTVLAPLMPRLWLAPINIVLYISLELIRRELRRRKEPVCSRLNSQVSMVILVTAIALVVLSIYEPGRELYEINGQPYDAGSPLLTILFTSPLACIVTLCYLFRRTEPMVCRRCKMRYGNVIEEGFVGDLFRKEWRYQTRLLFFLSLALTVVDWTYYLTRYINTNISRADQFFFIWMPLSMYVLSLVYLGMRYYSLWVYYCQNDEGHYIEQPSTTTLRYLVIKEDRMLLRFHPTGYKFGNGQDVKRFDTPAVITTSYHEHDNPEEAIRGFRALSGLQDVEIRKAYDSPDEVTYRNIFHYFAFIPRKDDAEESRLTGEWFTWGQVLMLESQGLLDRALVSELGRIYRIAMAWKTYDDKGRRLYRIKHYKPTFRLRDIHNWNVDYNDLHWLRVATTNEAKFWYPVFRPFVYRRRVHPGTATR